MRLELLVLAMLSSVWLGCGPDEEPPPDAPPDCVPSEAAWDEEIHTLIEDNCTECHNETPDFGAPFSLLEYATLIEGPEPHRIVDRMVIMLSTFAMPPIDARQPDVAVRRAITEWASCGETTIDDPTGIGATRPAYRVPVSPPELEEIALQLEGTTVEAGADQSASQTFRALVEEDVYIYRFDVEAQEGVDLITLGRIEGDARALLYAWAPGTGPLEFLHGGLRLRPEDELEVQVHYDNRGGAERVDSSGVSLWIGRTRGPEHALIGLGPAEEGFELPAEQSTTIEHRCVLSEEAEGVELIATMPHMRALGAGFTLSVQRAGEDDETLVLALEEWRADTQLFYDTPLSLQPGETLITRCDFDNPQALDVQAGSRAEDEVCVAFSYASVEGALPQTLCE